MDNFHLGLIWDNSPILPFYRASADDYHRHIASIITWGDLDEIQKIQDSLDRSMKQLKETWDFKEKLSGVELTGTYAELIKVEDNVCECFMLAAPDQGPHGWQRLYLDACMRYGQVAAELMYPLHDGKRRLGSAERNCRIARHAFEAKLMGTLKRTYAEVLRGNEKDGTASWTCLLKTTPHKLDQGRGSCQRFQQKSDPYPCSSLCGVTNS